MTEMALRVWTRAIAAVAPLAVTVGLMSPVQAALAAPRPSGPAVRPVARVTPEAFGPNATHSDDVAINGYGDAAGYHLEVGRAAGGFAWREIAVLSPAGYDDSDWTGYQCLSGNGRFAAVAILPTAAANIQAARDHGGFAYAVNLTSGKVFPIAAGVSLQYDSPGCGTGDTAVFTVSIGADQQTTQLINASLATGKVTSSPTVAGQITSPVPASGGDIGVLGSDLVRIPGSGRSAKVTPLVLAKVGGQPFDVRPAIDGGLNFLDVRYGSQTSSIEHEQGGHLTVLGSGNLTSTQLFEGAAGHSVLVGARRLSGSAAADGIVAKSEAGLKYGASGSSLDGNALFGPSANKKDTVPVTLATQSGQVLTDPQAAPEARVTSALPSFHVSQSVLNSTPQPQIGTPEPRGNAAPSRSAKNAIRLTAAQTPVCAVPRLQTDLQVMQPSNAQVDWAAQMAEQGLLTGSQYTRPAGFDNLGLAAYAPNSDFPLIALDHPSGDSWDTVPRSVFEAIMAQESNWDQASWHAPPGIAGDPLIADYYGSGGSVSTIDYADADCGYGISQVTDGMETGETEYSVHGQIKIAVDYQENIAAGLQIIESTWNQLYTDGITVNGGDPRYLENWYDAAWAYNSGIEPDAANGNTTGCTPGPSCTGPDGTWGLGWANNPENPAYPPSRAPFLKDSYADAATPGDWPYQEKVMGWMASPLQRYSAFAYSGPTYNGGQTWLQIAPFDTFCSTSANDCNPNATNTSNPSSGHCMLNDDECWFHAAATWISSCSTTCATSSYAYTTGSSEPANPAPFTADCNVSTSVIPSNAVIVDSQPSPPLNLQGCSNENWTSNGTFTYSYGTDSNGDPIGAIDTHQVGAGLGGHEFFTHTETGSQSDLINTGTWTPNLPSLQYYQIWLHLPAIGGDASDVVYTINPGGSASPWKIRVNQAWNENIWVPIGTFAMENGGNVVLTNQSPVIDTAGTSYYNFDVAYDAIAFVPKGGTPGQPIGGPPTIQNEPAGSNPAWVQCTCGQATGGDPVDTATGYFSETWTDLSTPGRGMPLDFTRTYMGGIADPTGANKSLASNGPFGYGWTYSYNLFATTAASTGDVTITQEDGSQVVFDDSGGTYTVSAPRYDATLTLSGSNYIYTRRGHQVFTFAKSTGDLIAETDLAGLKASPTYQTTLTYNASNQLTTIKDPAGRTYTLTWSGGHITEVLDSAGREVTYAYDSSGDLTDVYGVGTTRSPSLENNDHMQYAYNTTTHEMTSFRTPKNYGGASSAVTAMTYDSSDRVLTQTDPDGDKTTFAYGPSDGLATGQTLVTDPSGDETLDTYSNGLLVSETKGYGTSDAGTWSYTYDPITLGISTETDPDGNLQTWSYDSHGNVIAHSDGLGRTTDYQYDNSDDLVETIDPAGVATISQYDQSGHIPSGDTGVEDLTSTTITEANNLVESPTLNFGTAPTRTTNYYYSSATYPGDRTSMVDPDNNTTTYTYDSYGDLTSVTDGQGNKTEYGYNTGTGWKTSEVDPAGVAAGTTTTCTPPKIGCTTYGYDAYGNLIKTTDALGNVGSAVYDADGNKTSSTDGNNNTTTNTYDAADRLTKSAGPGSITTTTVYNADGTVASTTNGLSDKTTYTYNAQGQQITAKNPDSKTTTWKYDTAGLLQSVTDPSSRATTYGYDAAGEMTSVSYSSGTPANVTFTYDPDGRKLTMTDGTGTTTWAYDAFGDMTSQIQGSGAAVLYGYDTAGNQTSITYPGQTKAVIQGFDKDNRLSSVTDAAGNKTSFGYDADSNPLTTAYPDGVTVTNGYDNAGNLAAIKAVDGSTTLVSETFTRDGADLVSGRTVGSTSDTYGYSAQDQLSSDKSGSTTTPYATDAASDPTTVGSATQEFDAAGELCWTLPSGTVSSPSCGTVPTGATKYTFDSEGDRTATTPSSGTASSYGYNQAGQLTSFTGPGGSATYGYDGAGLLTTKTTGGTTNTLTWDDSQQTPNLLTDGTNAYLYGPDGMPIEQVGASASYWFVHDQIGSTLALLSSTGTVVGSYSYTPYGVATFSGTVTTPLQYTGQYTDSVSGLVYLRARYYDPKTAEFLTVDPDLANTGIPYAYVGDSPLTYTDLLGLCGGFFGFVCSTVHWLSKPGHVAAVLGVSAVVVSLFVCAACDLVAAALADSAFVLSGVQAGMDCSQDVNLQCGVDIASTVLAGAGGALDSLDALNAAGEGLHAAESAFEGLANLGRVGDAFSVPYGLSDFGGGGSSNGGTAAEC
jgi:RHS repeat-associated protein